MLRLWKSLTRFIGRFGHDRSGASLLLFSLAFVPIMMALGVTIDYARLARARSALSAAADAAALSGVAAANQYVARNGTSPASLSAAVTVAQNAAQNTFSSNTAGLNGATLSFTSSTPTVTAASSTVSVSAQASTPLMIRFPGSSSMVGASATATSQPGSSGATPQFIDVYVLVDNSQSMAIGANYADQANMVADPKIGCMLACHRSCQLGKAGCDPTSSSYGNVYNGTATGYFDSVSYARSKYTLRFDVVKNALNTIAAQAQAFQTANPGSVVRFGIYTFANQLNTVVPITPSYGNVSTQNTILWGVNEMEIADTLAGTELNNALQNFYGNHTISPLPGDGSSAASPKVFVLLMTDGVVNANYTMQPTTARLAAGSAYDWTFSPTIVPSWSQSNCWGTSDLPTGANYPWPGNSGPAHAIPATWPGGVQPASNPPPCVPDPTVAATGHIGNNDMALSVLDPSNCTAIKNTGATLMTLETTYVTDTADPYDWRTIYLANFLLGGWSATGVNYVSQSLQACASSTAHAYTANSATDIQNAIAAMFQSTIGVTTAGNMPHLTQ